MSDIANKDESRKCLAIARQAILDDQLEKAEKFALKAQRLYASMEVQAVLESIESARAAKRSSASHTAERGSGSGSQQHHNPQANGHAHGHGHRQSGPSGPNLPPKRTEGSRPKAAPAQPVEDPGTPEQRKLVAEILAAKDYYAILSLARDATDDDVKKAYRKLALKLHPDKNKALHSEEAFKAVSRAFNCLSDADKRAYYDRTGYESSAAASAAAAAQRSAAHSGGHATHYYAAADDFDPEEIFNMFFGGGLGGPNARVFRASFGVPRQRHHHHGGHGHGGQHHGGHSHGHGGQGGGQGADQQQRAAMLGLLQLMPIVLILLFTFFQSSQSPPYSLVRESAYNIEVLTSRLAIPFYVKSNQELERSYPVGSSARFRLERQVESAYYERLEARCQQERLMRHRAWSWGNREQARAMKLEACEEIDRVNEKLGMRRQQTAY